MVFATATDDEVAIGFRGVFPIGLTDARGVAGNSGFDLTFVGDLTSTATPLIWPLSRALADLEPRDACILETDILVSTAFDARLATAAADPADFVLLLPLRPFWDDM